MDLNFILNSKQNLHKWSVRIIATSILRRVASPIRKNNRAKLPPNTRTFLLWETHISCVGQAVFRISLDPSRHSRSLQVHQETWNLSPNPLEHGRTSVVAQRPDEHRLKVALKQATSSVNACVKTWPVIKLSSRIARRWNEQRNLEFMCGTIGLENSSGTMIRRIQFNWCAGIWIDYLRFQHKTVISEQDGNLLLQSLLVPNNYLTKHKAIAMFCHQFSAVLD